MYKRQVLQRVTEAEVCVAGKTVGPVSYTHLDVYKRQSLDSEGTAAFAEATANNIGKQLSIYVDDKLISSPTVNSAITGGSGVIEGSFTAESAQELACLLYTSAGRSRGTSCQQPALWLHKRPAGQKEMDCG